MSTSPCPGTPPRGERRLFVHALACVAFAALLICGGACANTELQGSWRSTKYNGPKFTRVMVLAASKQPTTRRLAEDAFVAELRKHGVEGIPSYAVFPGELQIDRAELERVLKAQGAQGVIIAQLVKVDREASYSAPVGSMGAAGGYYGAYSTGFSTSYVQAGSSYEYDVVTIDVRLYEVATEELVWSGSTQTFDTSNLERSAQGWAQVVIAELAKRGLI